MSFRTIRLSSPALFLAAAALVSACGGGGSSSSGGPPPPPPNTPTPTPVPTFTQGPTPPPTCPNTRNPISEPLAVATPMSFPNVDGYCGLIEFPSGSSPVQGNDITLSTYLQGPGGYPASIPAGAGNYGVGAVAVKPWLSFSLTESLSTNNQDVSFSYIFPVSPPVKFYYVGVYDLTANPAQPFLTYPTAISITSTCTGGGSSPSARRRWNQPHLALRRSPAQTVRLRVRPSDVIGGDTYYFGLFAQDDGPSNITSTVSSLDASGGNFTMPALPQLLGGFKGTVPYGATSSGSGAQMLLTSSNVDCTGGEVPPLQNAGTPVFYESFILTAPTTLNFQINAAYGALKSSSIAKGGLYDVYWYDVTNVTPSMPATLLLHSPSLVAGDGVVYFPTLFTNGYAFNNQSTVIAEFVKD